MEVIHGQVFFNQSDSSLLDFLFIVVASLGFHTGCQQFFFNPGGSFFSPIEVLACFASFLAILFMHKEYGNE